MNRISAIQFSAPLRDFERIAARFPVFRVTTLKA
jgi:hypothetical protein